jgi:glycine cleavage system H protein
MNQPSDDLRYKRSRFSARLPMDRRYAPSHFWLLEYEPGVWRVGFTKFAIRMLGDIVEADFEIKPNAPVQTGVVVGWVEAFKAVADLYCVMPGTFETGNPALATDPSLIDSDPHGEGWLYAVRGTPGDEIVDAEGYTIILDAQIDKMIGEEKKDGS